MEVDGSNGSFHGSVVEASVVGGGVEASTTVLSSTEVHDHIRWYLAQALQSSVHYPDRHPSAFTYFHEVRKFLLIVASINDSTTDFHELPYMYIRHRLPPTYIYRTFLSTFTSFRIFPRTSSDFHLLPRHFYHRRVPRNIMMNYQGSNTTFRRACTYEFL